MLEEIVVAIEDGPGVLAEVGELLGRSGVNIETLCASTHNGQGVIHIVVDDSDDAAEVLKSNKFKILATHPVLSTTLDDRPGELGRYCRKLSTEGIVISSAYVMKRSGGESELILAVDDLETAQHL